MTDQGERGPDKHGPDERDLDKHDPDQRDPDENSPEGTQQPSARDDDELEAVLSAISAEITPDAEERAAMEAAVEELTDRVHAALEDLPVEAAVLQVGSTARGTWLSGDRDIDLFVSFPADLDRAELEEYGLLVGREVLPDGREEYAEHPYTTGEFRGFDVDLVPCYDVEDATAIKSAVDRTPFHNAYLETRLDPELRDDVRLFKRFLKGIDAYGSDLRTRGFSGYLTELLVVEYGGVRPLLAAAADWQPPVRFDPADHGEATFDDPLVVIDPTDPGRNVAAVLSAENLARLQHYARELLTEPHEELFAPSRPDPMDEPTVRARIDERGTTPIAIVLDTPDIVEDQLYPQLERSLSGVRSALDRRGFTVLRDATFANDRAVLLVELAVAELPVVERHDGPPVAAREHATGFYRKYADESDEVSGPFLDGERYVVERPRSFTSAAEFLESEAIFDVALGARVETSMAEGYEVLVGPEVATLAGAFGREFGAYFDPKP